MKILNSLNKIANLSTTLSGLGRDLLQYSDEPNLTVLSKQQMAQNWLALYSSICPYLSTYLSLKHKIGMQ